MRIPDKSNSGETFGGPKARVVKSANVQYWNDGSREAINNRSRAPRLDAPDPTLQTCTAIVQPRRAVYSVLSASRIVGLFQRLPREFFGSWADVWD
jgi:hypothetical protein